MKFDRSSLVSIKETLRLFIWVFFFYFNWGKVMGTIYLAMLICIRGAVAAARVHETQRLHRSNV